MNQDDIDKNGGEKVPLNILVPRVNWFLLKDVKSWAKSAYHKARLQIGWRKARKIKEVMPIEMADYAVRKTFGNWRLVAPSGVLRPASGVQTQDAQPITQDAKSPLQQVIEAVRPYIVANRWGQFRRKFVRLLKLAFNAICDADYDPEMVEQMNGWLKDLLDEFGIPHSKSNHRLHRFHGLSVPSVKSVVPHLSFVLLPETAIGYSAPEMLAIRSAIWERFTGKGLDPAQYANPTAAGRLMEMELVISTAPPAGAA